jgi:hypothetical protein
LANPRHNKRKGHDYELKAINELKAEGYDAIHSGASLGPFDIWATNDKHLRKIQVKSVVKARSFAPLLKQLAESKEPPGCVKELWVWLRFKGWTKTVVSTGT